MQKTAVLPAGSLQIDAGGFWVGREQDCLGGCFDPSQDFLGSIDDIRIYNRLLTEEEIQTLYQEGKDCKYATYSPQKKTLTIPFIEMPVTDFLTGQPTGETELWEGKLRQVFGTMNRFRVLSTSINQIVDGSSSSCPATYTVETGTLSVPYIDVPTGIEIGNKTQENQNTEVFKALMTWDQIGKSFIVQEVEQVAD